MSLQLKYHVLGQNRGYQQVLGTYKRLCMRGVHLSETTHQVPAILCVAVAVDTLGV